MPALPQRSSPACCSWPLAATALALALLAGACLLALFMFFESGDRARLHTHLQQAHDLLAQVDDAVTLLALPVRLRDSFASQPDLAVRIQGPYGQILYEQGTQADMPADLLARAPRAPPAPLRRWSARGHAWRGSALMMRMPMEGAAPLTAAVALDVQRQQAFLVRLAWALIAYLLLSCTLLAWLARRASTLAARASGKTVQVDTELPGSPD